MWQNFSHQHGMYATPYEQCKASPTLAFAAQLYPGGCTMHLTLKVSHTLHLHSANVHHDKIPVISPNKLLEPMISSFCNCAELICCANLIIWDKAPMPPSTAYTKHVKLHVKTIYLSGANHSYSLATSDRPAQS